MLSCGLANHPGLFFDHGHRGGNRLECVSIFNSDLDSGENVLLFGSSQGSETTSTWGWREGEREGQSGQDEGFQDHSGLTYEHNCPICSSVIGMGITHLLS